MNQNQIIDWLLEGDVAIQYHVNRHLLGIDLPDLRERIASEGWGAQLLAARRADVCLDARRVCVDLSELFATEVNRVALKVSVTPPPVTEGQQRGGFGKEVLPRSGFSH